MTFKTKARRAGWLLVIAAFAFGIVAAIRPSPASAYGLISSRSVQLSNSEGSATAGYGTNVIYKVSFTTVTNNQTVGSIVVKFCDNDPILGDTCTAPPGLNTNFATLSLNNTSPAGLFTGMTINTTTSTANMVVMNRSAQQTNFANAAVSFELGNGSTNGFTNPTASNHTYFARIFVFSSLTPDLTQGNESAASPTGPNDAGGAAMATANVLNVTAKVQEQLTFCVYTAANCAGGGSAYALGDSNGVLAATNTTYLNASGKFDLASNALSGVIVRLKGDTLKSGSNSIAADGATCVADSTTTTVAQFGIRVVTYGTGQSFGGAAAGDVNDFGCTAGFHKFDPTTTNTTYGQNFVKTVGATDVSTSNFELAAKASTTTPAGVYNTVLQLIATGTY